jgi:hypothetical protein
VNAIKSSETSDILLDSYGEKYYNNSEEGA